MDNVITPKNEAEKESNAYYKLMYQLNSKHLFRGLIKHGMFHDKLAPFLTSEVFYNHLKHNFPCDFATAKSYYSATPRHYIQHNTIRNTGTPRTATIPNPFAYAHIASFISDKYNEQILPYVWEQVKNNTHRISRTHVRYFNDEERVFKMNYSKSHYIDGTSEINILLDKSVLVKADISNCFPSMYAHSLPWVGLGKDIAKKYRRADPNGDKNIYFWNQLDLLVRNMQHGETDGLPIGPHLSNLLSELILLKIDKTLVDKKWEFTRHIDDYKCYVKDQLEANKFISDLRQELAKYNLDINHRKTEFLSLPVAFGDPWINQLETLIQSSILDRLNSRDKYKKIRYSEMLSYLDGLLEITKINNMNLAILNYGLKMLRKHKYSNNALELLIKTILHWSLHFPYLIPLLDELILESSFSSLDIEVWQKYIETAFTKGMETNNYEQLAYCLYYITKYPIEIHSIEPLLLSCSFHKIVFDLRSPVLNLVLHYYLKEQNNSTSLSTSLNTLSSELKDLAKDQLSCIDIFEESWIFAYEVLSKSDLVNNKECDAPCENTSCKRTQYINEWIQLKNSHVSFLRKY